MPANTELPEVPLAFRTGKNQYLSVTDRDEVKTSRVCRSSEFFVVEEYGPGLPISIKSSRRGKYLSLASDGSVRAVDDIGESERFRVEFVEVSRVGIRSVHGRYLSVKEDGTVVTAAERGPSECFYVEDYVVAAALDELKLEGYTVLRELITPQQAGAIKKELQLLEQSGAGIRTAVQNRIQGIVYLGESFARLLVHPVVISVLRGYLGDNVRCAQWASNTLLPQDATLDAGLGWHVDYPYHDMEQPWPELPMGAQVLWLLDDFRANNGATMFLPDTQKLLKAPFEDYSNPPGARIVEAPAGSVLISHAAWWHRQTRNVSGKTRSALLGNFVRSFVGPKSNVAEEFQRLTNADFTHRINEPELASLRQILVGPQSKGIEGIHDSA